MAVRSSKFSVVILAAWSALVMGLVTGCASGGFKLTRQYAGIVNRQHIILRIVLYILTAVVFVVTIVLDVVVFNTVDFWEGRVSQGTYHFEKDGTSYVVNHTLHPESRLRKSQIQISNSKLNKFDEVVLRETKDSNIEVFVNGVLKATVSDISLIPKISTFNAEGETLNTLPLWSYGRVAVR